ncbi:MAG: YbaN family protein [Bacteroidales bacterium]|nr:YbaN family protein [Bacteroidales bacterium]
MVKFLFIVLGTVSLSVGVLGIFLPGLPTTVFLLITAFLYARSSEKLYNKLLNNKYVGPYITNFRKYRGMTLKSKIYSISMMWTMIFLSTYFLIPDKLTSWIVIGLGFVGTVVMGFVLRTVTMEE